MPHPPVDRGVARFEPRVDARPNDEAWPAFSWPVDDATELRGRSVVVRRADPRLDGEELFDALDDDRVWAHVKSRPSSVGDVRHRLESRSEDPHRHEWVVRAAQALPGVPEGAVIGQSSFLDVVPGDARLEIGFTAYVPAVWGTVVNPEVKLLLLEFAFTELGAGRVQLKTDIRNVRSQQAIARLGAQFEGVLRRHARRDDGSLRDSVLFSIIAEEWPSVRQRLIRRVDEVFDR